MCSRLNEVILSYDNKILIMEAEINRVRSECENKIEILSRNSCDLSLEHKYEKLFEAKVNKFEDTVSNLKADILKL